jgi:hypothetical protein
MRKVMAMTGDAISELFTPLVGKSGSISIIARGAGEVTFALGGGEKLTGVRVRPDGLVRLDRETGWTVLDPGEIAAVTWHGTPDSSPGQFL